MTLRDESRCPRCGQPIEFQKGGRACGAIKAHRDDRTGEPCPTKGMMLGEAERWVADARAAVRAMSL
jgi:hypothetical protein